MAYVPDANNTAEPTSARPAGSAAAEFRAIKSKIASVIAGMVVTSAAGANAADIATFLQPDINDRPAMVAGGWLPWNFMPLGGYHGGQNNAPFHWINAADGAEYRFDPVALNMEDGSPLQDTYSVGDAAARTGVSQGFKVGRACTVNAIWLKLAKGGNPTDNWDVRIQADDGTGKPTANFTAIANGQSNTISGRQVSTEKSGDWYRFDFATPCALAANTQYHIVLKRSGAVDALNYLSWKTMTTAWHGNGKRYPYGNICEGSAVPAWTAFATTANVFIIEGSTADNAVQAGGQFAGKIVGAEGTLLNSSVGYVKPLKEFMPLFDANGWSILIRGRSWTKDRTIAELVYGLHHDRINIRAATGTGFCTVTLYERDGTVNTITGTSDLSTNVHKDILIVGRTLGDGADYIKIYVGVGGVWTKEVEAITQTYTLDPLMGSQGHMWIMGGFPLWNNTNYSKLSEMNTLPSADGWTFGGSAAEGSVFNVTNGKLYQIRGGNGGAQDGYYSKTAAGIVNANGWAVVDKSRVNFGTNIKNTNPAAVRVRDGTRDFTWVRQGIFNGFHWTFGVEGDFVITDNKLADAVNIVTGKGNDIFAFRNGRFIYDGTGKSTVASAVNQIDFGDLATTAGENNDVVWDYVGYLTTAQILPQFSSGELSELVVFSGDKNLLGAAVYNTGAPLSVKQYCGLSKRYVNSFQPQIYDIRSYSAPACATNALTFLTDFECYGIGTRFEHELNVCGANNTGGMGNQFIMRCWGGPFHYTLGGAISGSRLTGNNSSGPGAGYFFSNTQRAVWALPLGIHRFDAGVAVGGGTFTRYSAPAGSMMSVKSIEAYG